MIFNINLVLHLFASSQLVSLAEWVWQHYDDLISRISAYHMQLCTFSILQDTNSQDWNNSKPFYEVNQFIIIVLIMLMYHCFVDFSLLQRAKEYPFIFKCGVYIFLG